MTAAVVTAAGVVVDRAVIRRQRIFGVVYLLAAAVIAFVLTSGIEAGDTSTFGLKPAGQQGGLDIPSLEVPTTITLYLLAAI